MSFDPYHRWLGIPKSKQPADYYRLLGLDQFEDDVEVIRDAAERQIAHVRRHQAGEHKEAANKILNALALAEITLTDDGKRADYDAQLSEPHGRGAGGSERVESLTQVEAAVSESVEPEAMEIVAEKRNCPSCYAPFVLKPELIGKVLRCPQCRHEFEGGREEEEAARLQAKQSASANSATEDLKLVAGEPASKPASQHSSTSPSVPVGFSDARDYSPKGSPVPAHPAAYTRPIVSRRPRRNQWIAIAVAGGASLLLVSVAIAVGIVYWTSSVPSGVVANDAKKLSSTNRNMSIDAAAEESGYPVEIESKGVRSEISSSNQTEFASEYIPDHTATPASLSAPFSRAEATEARDRWAEHLKIKTNYESSAGLSFVLVPPGGFMMGSDKYDWERPIHKVQISKPLYFALTEVSREQWMKVMGTTPWQVDGKDKEQARMGGDMATYISWNDATEFCNRLSESEGKTYRLPTEAEWEYACRAGSTTEYNFGDADNALKGLPKNSNAFGLFRMHDTVTEWCQDVFDADYYSRSPQVDPVNLDTGSFRVARGGLITGWAGLPHSALRDRAAPTYDRSGGIGFRVLLEATQDSGKISSESQEQAIIEEEVFREEIATLPNVSGLSFEPRFVECARDSFVMHTEDVPLRIRRNDAAQHPIFNKLMEDVVKNQQLTIVFLVRDAGVDTYNHLHSICNNNDVRHGKFPVDSNGRTGTLTNPKPVPEGAKRLTFICVFNKIYPIQEALFRDPIKKQLEAICKSDPGLYKSTGIVDQDRFFQKIRKVQKTWRDDDCTVEVVASGINLNLRFTPKDSTNAGVKLAEVENSKSRFRKLLATIDNRRYYVKFIVYSDSFDVYLSARAALAEQNLLAGWEPRTLAEKKEDQNVYFDSYLASNIFFGEKPNLNDENSSKSSLQETITNSIGMKLNLIPAGKFMMGWGSPELDTDGAMHEVEITQPFHIGIFEVTQKEWKAVMDSEPWRRYSREKENPNHPASVVSWEDAYEFCERLSAMEGKTYRLPTEAQWEYACRAGSRTAYSFGESDQELGEYAWYRANAYSAGESYPHEVGKKKANGFGLHDMHGNAWEWCQDVYDREFYRKRGSDRDPLNASVGYSRVMRGGSCSENSTSCRSAVRHEADRETRYGNNGFRVVLLASPTDYSLQADSELLDRDNIDSTSIGRIELLFEKYGFTGSKTIVALHIHMRGIFQDENVDSIRALVQPMLELSGHLRSKTGKLEAIRQKTLIAVCLSDLSEALLQHSQNMESEKVVREAIFWREQTDDDFWWLYYSKCVLAEALSRQGKHDEALPLLKVGHKGLLQRKDQIPKPFNEKLKKVESWIAKYQEDFKNLN